MKRNKVNVIINQQHTLLPQQQELINKKFKNINFIKVPSNGWTLKEQTEQVKSLLGQTVVFVSPVPYMLASLSLWRGYGLAGNLQEVGLSLKGQGTKVFLFHNDNRDKKELPNGKVISVISATGWELVEVK